MAKGLVVACAGDGILFRPFEYDDVYEGYRGETMSSSSDDIKGFVSYGVRAARMACLFDIRIPEGSSRQVILDVVVGPVRKELDDSDEGGDL